MGRKRTTHRVYVVRSKIDGLGLHKCFGIDAVGTVIRSIPLPGSLKNPSSPTPMRCHGSKPLIYVLMSFTHSVTKAGVQFDPLGMFRTPSAPQRGSLLTCQSNTTEEFLYRVTTASTYSLKAALIFGILKNCIHPAGANDLVPQDEEY